MFLFDKQRSSQQSFETGNEILRLNWKTDLNTNPIYGAESTAVFDENENIYFGSHSGNFYSLDKEGSIRWVYTTKVKIYSSPILLKEKIIFAGGDGFLYCLQLDGKLKWKYDLSELSRKKNKLHRILMYLLHLPFTYSLKKRKNIIYKSWSSPNHINENIYITGYETGLYCLNLNGELLWKRDLGFPRYQLSGVAIGSNNSIFGSSRKGYAYCYSENGDLQWMRKIKLMWEPWGNPVVNKLRKEVYFFYAKHESKGIIYTTDYNGSLVWKRKFGAIRGSCAITKDGLIIYCCDLDGYLYKLSAIDGKIINKMKITNCSRGLWITPTLDRNEDILLSIKDNRFKGRVIKLNSNFEIIWQFETNKVLSVPLVNKHGDVLFGSWDGNYYSLKTR